MRLHRLVLQGVGPFKDRQTIDFDRLGQSRLFLIDGKTGSGKSTIIDCITFALFNSMAGSASGPERMRSDACGPEDETFVELTFSVDGRTYEVRRNPEYERVKRGGHGTTKQSAEVSLLITDADGAQITAPTKSREVVALIESVLGMTDEQFRRLVVLPQGEFAALLTASSSKRQEILEPLIAEPLYRRIQAELKDRLDRANALRSEVAAQVRDAATKFIGDRDALGEEDVDGLAPEVVKDSRARDDERLDAMDAVRAQVESLLSHAEAEAKRAAADADHARSDAEGLARVAVAALGLTEARRELEVAQSEADPADRTLLGRSLDDVLSAVSERLGRLAPRVQWEQQADLRRQQAVDRAAEIDTCEREREVLEDAEREHPLKVTQLEAEIESALLEGAGLEAHRSAAQTSDRLVQAAKRRDELVHRRDAARASLERAEAGRVSALQNLGASLAKVAELQKVQIGQRAALLAEGLAMGEPCPVCGSREHPALAVAEGEQALVTDADVDEAVSLARACERKRELSENDVLKARQSFDDLGKELAECSGALGVDAQTPVDELRERRAHARVKASDAEQSAERVQRLREQIQTLARASEDRRDRLRVIEGRIADLKGRDDEAARLENQVRSEIEREVGVGQTAEGIVNRETQRRTQLERLRDAQKELGRLAAEHPAAADVDAEDAQRRAQERQDQAVSVARRAKAIADRAAALRTTSQQMQVHRDEFADACARSEDVREATRSDVRLGELAVGGSLNIRKTDLATFAVQRKFSAVLEAASDHLRTMSMGRYAFDLDAGRKGNAKVGLNISITDSRHGGARDPKTLSGGETFYASLSLALGLAQVVQAEVGAARLEMLFVDEGFGSLDPDTLSVVIEQLERLQSSGRIVGVISHVSEMKAAISDKIEVIAHGDGTSSIQWPGDPD